MRQYVIIFFAGLLAGGLLAKKYYPTIEVKTLEKIVVKTEVQTKTHTVTKEVTLPNGTVEKSTTVDLNIVEKSKSDSSNSTLPNNWFLSVNRQWPEAYSIQVNRRVFGDVFISGSMDTKLNFGVGLGISF